PTAELAMLELPVPVGMKSFCEFVVGGFDLGGRRLASNSKDLVVVGRGKEMKLPRDLVRQAMKFLFALLCARIGVFFLAAFNLQKPRRNKRTDRAVGVFVRNTDQGSNFADSGWGFDSRKNKAFNRQQPSGIRANGARLGADEHAVSRREYRCDLFV